MVPEGMVGTVVMYEPDLISVKMDQEVAGAAPWNNEVQWHGDSLKEFKTDVKILGGQS